MKGMHNGNLSLLFPVHDEELRSNKIIASKEFSLLFFDYKLMFQYGIDNQFHLHVLVATTMTTILMKAYIKQ